MFEGKMSEDADLQKMREYVLLADRLQDRIDNLQNKEVVAEMGHILKKAIVGYAKAQKTGQELQKQKDEFYKRFDTKEKAEKYMRNRTKIHVSEYEPYIASAAATAYGFAACIAACFSRDASKAFLRKKDSYNKISKYVAETIKLKKETKQLENITIRQLSENEFKEARLIDKIREKIPINDDIVYDVVQQPELLAYAVIEIMKDRYAPDMEG